MKRITIYFFALLPLFALAQDANLERGNKLYRQGAYYSAIPYLEKYLSKHQDIPAAEKLGECYRYCGDMHNAEKWYGEALKFGTTKADPELVFHYAMVLRVNGKNEEAAKYFNEYGSLSGNYERAESFAQATVDASQFRRDSAMYRVMEMSYPGGSSDIAPSIMGQGLLISSSRSPRGIAPPMDVTTGRPIYDLYIAEKPVGIALGTLKPVEGEVNSRYHEGPACASPDGGTIYFTRSNYASGKLHTDNNGTSRLKIYASDKSGMKYGKPYELGFNGEGFSTGHPALTPDGNYMFFGSDREGGYGGMDIYIVKKAGNDWGVPENLGPEVNTPGNESFPSCPAEGVVLFASDGHPGLGGLDIFSSRYENGEWQKPENLGVPLNSNSDDFGIAWDINNSNGYFTTNRGKSGQDRIWYFERKRSIRVRVVESGSRIAIEGAEVEVLDQSGKKDKYVTNKSGEFTHPVKPGKEYFFTAHRQDYDPVKTKYKVTSSGMLGTDTLSIVLEGQMQNIVKGTIYDLKTGKPVNGATVEFWGEKNELHETLVTRADGKYKIRLDSGQNYHVIVSHKDYIPHAGKIQEGELQKPSGHTYNVYLEQGDYIMVEGMVVTFDKGIPIPNTELKIMDNQANAEVMSIKSGEDGKFWIPLKLDKVQDYSVLAVQKGYFASRIDIEKNENGEKKAIIRMRMAEYSEDVVVKVIYYAENESYLTPISRLDLNEIYYFLVENPEAIVELASHTDARGSDEYNLKLSQERSEAVVRYICEQKQVPYDRIIAKGYGEKFLVNDCDDVHKKCTDEGHAKNRRSELKVKYLKPVNPN